MLFTSSVLTTLLADNGTVSGADPGMLGMVWSSFWYFLLTAIGVGVVIFVHELGHFVAAKTFGVQCDKFYVGFDPPMKIGSIALPRTLGKFTYGETEYGIGIIPLGGYVKMLGQDDDPRNQKAENERIRGGSGGGDETDAGEASVDDRAASQTDSALTKSDVEAELDPRSFPAKPVWQRMIIISAGVVMNVITGVLFAAIAYGYGVRSVPAVVGDLSPGGPAWQAGVEPGGRIVGVADLQDEAMTFREMRSKILNEGLDSPDQPIDVAIRYEDGLRKIALTPTSHPSEKDFRMIGVSMPRSVTLDKKNYARPFSVAAETLTDADAGATLVAFDSKSLDSRAYMPGRPFFDFLSRHPDRPVELTLRRADDSEHRVTLPPQRAKSIGIGYAVGPILSLVSDGPAEQAGLRVGDQILSVNGEFLTAMPLAARLVAAAESMEIKVLRGEGNDTTEETFTVIPSDAVQTLPPTESIAGDIAVNSLGLAFEPLPIVGGLDASDRGGEVDDAGAADATSTMGADPPQSLARGDEIEEVHIIDFDALPETLRDNPRLELAMETWKDGIEFGPEMTVNQFDSLIQILPLGTRLRVLVKRPPEDRVVTTTATVQPSERFTFQRGLNFRSIEGTQQADSVGDAFALGVQEGKRRFADVLGFLGMLVKGRVKPKHIGGPVAIFDVAMNEAEKGFGEQLLFLTFLSMNLAILNFLPIPALDGGHMAFLTYELVAGRRANEQLEFRLTIVGVLFLLCLMVFVFANDLLRLVSS